MDPHADYYADADESLEVVAAAADDDGEVMAAVVVDDEDEEGGDEEDTEGEADAVVVPVMVEASSEVSPKRKAPTKKKGPTPKKSSKGGSSKGGKNSSSAKKKRKKPSSSGGSSTKEEQRFSRISSERLDAASKARSMLVEGAPTLPLVASDIHVRSFGRLSIEPATDRSKFSKANALYPVGYCCDRYEFSPVHGRILKMRCSILDGKKIKEVQSKMSVPVAVHLHDGPVFRIMWGQGIDEDKDDVEYPYDPYSMSAPLTPGSNEVDAVAIPTTLEGAGKPVIPRLGMRIQATFDRGQIFHGVITRVGRPDEAHSNKKSRKKRIEIEIQYDDGSMEIINFPDPEISLLLPEAEPDVDTHGNLEHRELNGLPVHTVIGMSPIEAWGKVMAKLGLTDEIISDAAMDAVVSARNMAFKEAKGKIESKGRARKNVTDPGAKLDGENASGSVHSDAEDGATDASHAEEDLQSKVESLRSELEDAKVQDRTAAVELADKRISALGSYLSNPFADKDPVLQQQSSWLALAVRKEKTKMGSTGNKKKIVTATDLLERNDTFYNAEIELLIEGLPGSEYCSSYIFQSMRSGGVAATNRAWVHEAQVRSEKEREKRLKASKEKKAKVIQHKEKEMKRKKRDDIRDQRKRQKLEEEEEKKKARIDERLARLNVQVEERLFKEACFQREKAIVALAKTFTREFNRRRRAAEIVAAQSISDEQRRNGIESETTLLPLPKLSKVFDEDVLRVWDFVSTYGEFFLQRGFIKVVPTIDSLQSAIDCLRNVEAGQQVPKKEDATSSLIDLAVALCKPLAASQTRLLFASLIALYPTLQKDFGAAFFNEINDVNDAKSSDKQENGEDTPPRADVLLPVNSMTWQDVARVSFLSDALGELGYSRQDSAHLLRGYRSAGHPNSKEARRLRRVEDFSIALLRQALSDGTQGKAARRPTIVRIEIPTTPSCLPTDWIFYLHTVRSMRSSDASTMKKNLEKAAKMLKEDPSASGKSTDALAKLDNCLEMIAEAESEGGAFKKARHLLDELLDSYVDQSQKDAITKKDTEASKRSVVRCKNAGLSRQYMGLLGSLSLTHIEYKKLVHARDEYMSDAMKLKEDMERQRRKENNEGDEDDEYDDDDEDDEDDDGVRTPKSNQNGALPTPADVAAAVVASQEESKPVSSQDQNSKADADAKPDTSGSQEEKASKPQSAAEVSSLDGKPKEEISGDSKKEAGTDKDDATGHDAMDMDNESDVKKDENGSRTEQPSSMEIYGDSQKRPPSSGPAKIGKPTQYDDFCADIPTAPELIRRCLAVLRSLALAGPSEPFLYPVDPQTNPGYYDMVLRPMCLWKTGKVLQSVSAKLSKLPSDADSSKVLEDEVDKAVLEFGRNVRLIAHNCHSYANAGPMVVSAGGEFLRIFERLFLDWVLAPTTLLTPLDELDDDKCVEHHVSDEDSTVLLCDGCEGNFNIARLDPPLTSVPKGDWYCPRCVSGRWWGHLDPRVGKTVQRAVGVNDSENGESVASDAFLRGKVRKCFFQYLEGSKSNPALAYKVAMPDGTTEIWRLDEIDESLKSLGDSVPSVRCIAALVECQGYGCARPDKSLLRELVPVPLNPNISDGAAQAALSSSVFRDTIHASGTLLLINPEEMKASEWLRLLLLLVMKSSASDVMQNLATKLETEAADEMAKQLESLSKVSDIADVLDEVDDDDDDPKGGNEERNEEEDDKEEEKEMVMNDEVMMEATETPKDVRPNEDIKEPKQKKVKEEPRQEVNGGSAGEALEKSEVKDDSEAPGNGEAKPSTVEIEPSAVEVVAAASDAVLSSQDGGAAQELKEVVVVDPIKERRSNALAEKSKRQKAREDSISAFNMKIQLRPTVASFEEDAVSQVIDSALASKHQGLSFASIRCRRMQCDFCGLTDVALGTPLVRVPDENEWNEIIPHAARSRRVKLVAKMEGKGISDDTTNELTPDTEQLPSTKFMSLTIRVGDEIVSCKEGEEVFDRTDDGGMLEFCPRNSEGFQNELEFRSETGLPHVTGSLSAHEYCAIAAHKARKVLVVQRFKERQLELADANAGMTCGRTLAIGKDDIGRFYWKFHKDLHSLLVFVPPRPYSKETGKWHRFSNPESIASLIVSLGKDGVAKDLKRAYPDAARMCKDGTWSSALWSRHFPNAVKALGNAGTEDGSIDAAKRSKDDYGDDEELPFEVNEQVLVESKSGKLLWDAKVVEVSHTDNEKVNGYRVRYTGWSTRFDEWVEPDRLVEPSDNNRQVQYEMLEEAATQRDGFPPALNQMEARRFFNLKDRARGGAPLPDFAMIAHANVSASTDDKNFALLKAAVLLIEAALPLGAVDITSKGPWKPDLSQQWRLMVERSEGPAKLLRCVILLEDAISEEWLQPDVSHLRSCLPNRWKALREVSVASLAVRVETLDRCVLFGRVDKKKFVEPKKKEKK